MPSSRSSSTERDRAGTLVDVAPVPAPQLHVAVPGETYREVVLTWTPWLMSVARTPPSRLGAWWRRPTGRA
jgi:hypothetical protein